MKTKNKNQTVSERLGLKPIDIDPTNQRIVEYEFEDVVGMLVQFHAKATVGFTIEPLETEARLIGGSHQEASKFYEVDHLISVSDIVLVRYDGHEKNISETVFPNMYKLVIEQIEQLIDDSEARHTLTGKFQ